MSDTECTCVRHRDGVWFYVVADPECPAHGDLADTKGQS